MTSRRFLSKLLLFGEYTIIDNGYALSIPFERFFGKWAVSTQKSELLPFFEYLMTLEDYNRDKLAEAIKNHWIFKSNIPQGYGLGSSGALSAAAYDAFAIDPSGHQSDHIIKLSEIESFFHGSSSGLDPLTSFYNKSVVVYDSNIQLVSKLALNTDFFILDSSISRDAKTLIHSFKEKKANSASFQSALIELNLQNKQAIDAMLCANTEGVKRALQKISVIQLEHFKEMIPETIAMIWEKGLHTEDYFIKLAGAGGGGFFLGIGENKNLNFETHPITFAKKN